MIDGLVRGASMVDDRCSQLAALGWRTDGPVAAVVGQARTDRRGAGRGPPGARRPGFDAMAGVHGGRLVVVLGGVGRSGRRPPPRCSPMFADGPVVVGPTAADVGARQRGHPGRVERPARGSGLAWRAAAGERRRSAARTGARRRRRGARAS